MLFLAQESALFVNVFPSICLAVDTGDLRGSVVRCWTHNPVVMNRTGSSGFFMGVFLGKTLQSPSLIIVKPREDMDNVSCCSDKT